MSTRRSSRRIQQALQHQAEEDDQASDGEEMEEGTENGGGEEDDDNEEDGDDDGSDSEGDDDDDADDGDDGDGDSSSGKKRGRGKGKGQASDDSKKAARGSSKGLKEPLTNVSQDEMIHNSILYLLLQHHKKLPIKRADIVRNAMSGQLRVFPEVIEKVKNIFDEKFGIQLVGVEESRAKASGYSSYILVSKYPQSATEAAKEAKVSEADTKRAILYLILGVIFMLGRSIDEDIIWQMISTLQLNALICRKRDDLRKFLKTEYVSPLYLHAEEVKETEQIYYRYSWGLRAEKEISKWEMLKFMTKQFPEKKPYDFTAQYSIVLEHERELVEADRRAEQEERRPDDDMDDGAPDSASQIIDFDQAGGVASVQLQGRGADKVTLRGMRPATPNVAASMEVDESAAVAAANGLVNGGGEPMEEDDNESESGSESGSGSGTGSDEAQEGSDANSVSESSGSGSESDSD